MKHREVLTRQSFDNWGYVGFQRITDGHVDRPTTLRMAEYAWDALGRPETITVTVEAGEPKRPGRPPKNG